MKTGIFCNSHLSKIYIFFFHVYAMVYTGFHETFTGLQEKSSGFHVFLHIGVDRVPFFPGNWVSDAPVFMCFATLPYAASHCSQANG